MTTRATQADPLGYDVKIGLDLDAGGRAASGAELVADAILHRMMVGRLLLTEAPEDEADYGEDVRAWVGEALSQEQIEARGPRLQEVLSRDPRIASVAVALRVATGADASRYRFIVAVSAATITGEIIDRIVGVSQVTVDFLAQGA